MCKTWPIDPSFISGSYQLNYSKFGDSVSPNPNTDGLFESDILREFLAVSSLDFKGKCKNEWTSQFPLFQLIPKDGFVLDNPAAYDEYPIPDNSIFDELRQEYKLYRIDAKEFHYASGNKCCKYFKENIDKECCRKNDSRVLLLFLASRHIPDCSDAGAFRDELQRVCDSFVIESGGKEGVEFKAEIFNGKRAYIKYICEISGFVEFLFPVIVEGKVIAGVILGQRLPKGAKAESFFPQVCNSGTEHGEKMKELIKQMMDSLDTEHSVPLTESKLAMIDDRLHSLENRIKGGIKQKAREISNSYFEEIEKSFREGVSLSFTGDSELEQQMADYRQKLDDALKQICCYFDPGGDIRAFALPTLPVFNKGRGPLKFELIGDSKQGGRSEEDTINSIEFSYDVDLKVTGKALVEQISRPRGININKNDVFDASSFSFGKYRVLLWCRFSNWTKKHPEQYRVFKTDLLSACHSFFEPYYILQATASHDWLVSVTGIIGHETKQIIPVICNKLNKHFGLDKIVDMRFGVSADAVLNEYTRTAYDVWQRIQLLENIYERSTCLYREVTPTKKYHDFHRLVYAIKSLYDEDTLSEISQRLFSVDFPQELNNYDIYTDKQLLSHILFNLVDNAKKYGYPGTVTRIIVRKDSSDRPSLTISVVSYGAMIEDTERIFSYKYRSPRYAQGQSEGQGIGLFLVSQYCSSLNYKIFCSSEKLFNINVPLLYAYNNLKNHFNREIKMSAEIMELTRTTIPVTVIDEVVNKNYLCINLGSTMMTQHLKEMTYRNTFTIVMPNDSGLNLLKHK